MDVDLELGAGEPGELLAHDGRLELTLVGERGMLEVAPSADAFCGVATGRRHPVGRGPHHLDGIRSDEPVTDPALGHPSHDPLPRKCVPDEHHLALVPRDAVATVRDGSHVERPLRPDEAGSARRSLPGSATAHVPPPRTEPGMGGMSIQSRSAPSEEASCHGTLTTITPGVKSSRALRRSALWLWRTCSHHLPRTYSGQVDRHEVPRVAGAGSSARSRGSVA